MKYIHLLIIISAAFFFFSCNLEQEIDLELPTYDSQPIVECYLEPGQPFSLALSRSAAYFDPFPSINNFEFLETILISGAEVTITHNGKVYELENRLYFNTFTNKFFNYYLNVPVPQDFDQDFELSITLSDGSTIQAKTRMLPAIPIDSVVVELPDPATREEADTLYRALTYFTDPPSDRNYIRRMLHTNSLDSIPDQDFVTDDRFVEDLVVFGSGYDFAVGDTVINTIYHIDETYFNFLQSLFIARDSNGNPFAQPSPIISDLTGTANAIGIFTFLSFDRVTTIIKK